MKKPCVLLLDTLVVIFPCKLLILFVKICATMIVRAGFGSAFALIEVTVDVSEVDGSAGWHIVILVV